MATHRSEPRSTASHASPGGSLGSPCPGPASAPLGRRSFLQLGSLGLGGFGLADWLRLRAAANEPPAQQRSGTQPAAPLADPQTSVIFIWLPGGPPHVDMYDMKPAAPVEYRGLFDPVPSRVAGMEMCELMPHHARTAHQFSIIRSVAHTFADHGGGHKRFMTGRDPLEPTGFVNDFPAAPSFVAKARSGRDGGLPPYVSFTDGGRDGVDVFSFGAAYLGSACTPFAIPGDPSSDKFTVPNISVNPQFSDRLEDRLSLLRGFDRVRRAAQETATMQAMDEFQQRATSLLTSTATRDAFDLTQESDATRQRYGQHAWGSRALLARRLVEAGCSFVTVVMENPYQSGVPWLKQGTYNWDSHAVNCHLFDDAKVRFPLYDQSVTALIEDLYQRGLDRRVLLVVTGEFGRTPRVENVKGSQTGVVQPGRDHWPNAMSLIVAGGGLKTGQVIGSTTSRGEVPKDRPLSPNDVWATVFRHLGIDPDRSYPDHRGRPMPILPSGRPIAELI